MSKYIYKRLDLMTDGVNLVINFGEQKNELTKFYDTRVSYLYFRDYY